MPRNSYANPQPQPTLASIAPTSGAAGTEITLTGTGFTPQSRVIFGSLDRAPWFVNATTLKYTLPPETAAGTIALKVRNGDGQESAASKNFALS